MLSAIAAFLGAFVIAAAKLYGYAMLGLALLALTVTLAWLTVGLLLGQPLAKLPKPQVRQRDDRCLSDLDHGPSVLAGPSRRNANRSTGIPT